MIKYQNNTISRLYGGNTPAYTLISGGTAIHGEYVQPSNTDLTTLTYDTPSGIIDTKTNLNASANTGVELIYSSDDTSIATVDSSGVVAPKASGTTTITITAPTTTIGNTTYRGVQKRLEVECDAPSFNPLTDSGYFVIQAIANNPTVTVNKNGSPTGSMSYRKNGEGEWASINSTTSISLQNDDYLEIKGNIKNEEYSKQWKFNTNVASSIELGGYLMALNKNTEINNSNNTIDSATFFDIFRDCNGLISAEHLIFPSDVIDNCYANMFNGCSNLKKIPLLPVTELKYCCYKYMFGYCTSLISVQVPALIAGDRSYMYMFAYCTSLTSVELAATSFNTYTCSSMFDSCTSLTSIILHCTRITGYSPFSSWLNNVKTNGICYCPSDASYSASDLGLPSTWTLLKTL